MIGLYYNVDKFNVLQTPCPFFWRLINDHECKECKFFKGQLKDEKGNFVVCSKLLEDLINQKTIDPHFSDNYKYHSPVARFEPTEEGWEMGVQCLRSYM